MHPKSVSIVKDPSLKFHMPFLLLYLFPFTAMLSEKVVCTPGSACSPVITTCWGTSALSTALRRSNQGRQSRPADVSLRTFCSLHMIDRSLMLDTSPWTARRTRTLSTPSAYMASPVLFCKLLFLFPFLPCRCYSDLLPSPRFLPAGCHSPLSWLLLLLVSVVLIFENLIKAPNSYYGKTTLFCI